MRPYKVRASSSAARSPKSLGRRKISKSTVPHGFKLKPLKPLSTSRKPTCLLQPGTFSLQRNSRFVRELTLIGGQNRFLVDLLV